MTVLPEKFTALPGCPPRRQRPPPAEWVIGQLGWPPYDPLLPVAPADPPVPDKMYPRCRWPLGCPCLRRRKARNNSGYPCCRSRPSVALRPTSWASAPAAADPAPSVPDRHGMGAAPELIANLIASVPLPPAAPADEVLAPSKPQTLPRCDINCHVRRSIQCAGRYAGFPDGRQYRRRTAFTMIAVLSVAACQPKAEVTSVRTLYAVWLLLTSRTNAARGEPLLMGINMLLHRLDRQRRTCSSHHYPGYEAHMLVAVGRAERPFDNRISRGCHRSGRRPILV